MADVALALALTLLGCIPSPGSAYYYGAKYRGHEGEAAPLSPPAYERMPLGQLESKYDEISDFTSVKSAEFDHEVLKDSAKQYRGSDKYLRSRLFFSSRGQSCCSADPDTIVLWGLLSATEDWALLREHDVAFKADDYRFRAQASHDGTTRRHGVIETVKFDISVKDLWAIVYAKDVLVRIGLVDTRISPGDRAKIAEFLNAIAPDGTQTSTRALPKASRAPLRAGEPNAPDRGSVGACCRRCERGKPCGDSCIPRDAVCRERPGCAC